MYCLFDLRYGAIIYPFALVIAYALSKQAAWKKIVSVGITILVIITVENSVINETENATGTATFSAFGGWQLANNSMYVLKHIEPDSANFNSKTSKELCVFIKHYYDSLRMVNLVTDDSIVDFQFMWMNWSPLKRYMNYYDSQYYVIHPPPCPIVHSIHSWDVKGPIVVTKAETQYIITTFTTIGPVFNEFGTEVIKKYPLEYLRYFVWPNFKLFCNPPVQLYNYYNNSGVVTGHAGTLGSIETNYYNYPSNEIDLSYAGLLPIIMGLWHWLFPFINGLFILLVVVYYFKHGYKNNDGFSQCLIFYLAFYLSNSLFNIFIAPTLFRFYITIVTLSMAFIIYLWQHAFNVKDGLSV